MDLGLKGKCAVVTGAYRGTGRHIALTLAAEGAHVLVHGFDLAAAEVVAQEIRSSGGAATAIAGDITTDAGSEETLAAIRTAGGADILINNYGVAEAGSWTGSDSADWLDAYQKNVLSAVRLSRGLMDDMKMRGWGRIVMLGTIGSTEPAARMPHYYASKGALATLTISLAKELASTGITVNLVSPGLIKTPEVEANFLARGKAKGWGATWAEIEPHVLKHFMDNLTGHVTLPEEVADIVAFIASPRSGALTAFNMRVDGGATALVT